MVILPKGGVLVCGSKSSLYGELGKGRVGIQPGNLMVRRNFTAATSIAPEVKSPIDDEPVRVDGRNQSGKHRVRDLLVAIFEGSLLDP